MAMAKLRSLFRGLFRRSAVESGMNDEVRFHIESRAYDLIRSGLSREEALRRARLECTSRSERVPKPLSKFAPRRSPAASSQQSARQCGKSIRHYR
jgi:hypothetical protein